MSLLNHEAPRVTPKDFVLYAGLLISLYWSAVSLVTLWFQYIDRLFPDALNAYTDPFSSGIRFSMASLIIMVPVFLGLLIVIQNDIRAHTEKAGLWIRRWLLYITLLLAGIAIAGDLIALVNVFLAGELTARFVFKVLTVLIIAGGAFSYFVFDIRGYWHVHKQESRLVGTVVALCVFGSIIFGFYLTGGPATQRDLRFDQTRLSDLQSIQWQLVEYWQSKGYLPETLESLNDQISWFSLPLDPETNMPYEYRRTGTNAFELCATFARSSVDENDAYGMNGPVKERLGSSGGGNWNHPSGTHCFQRIIDPDRYPVREHVAPVLDFPEVR